MAYRFKMTAQALRDLKEIGDHSLTVGATDADEFAREMLARAESLTTFPYRHSSWAGRQNIRKVPFASYLIFYKVYDQERIVEILRFWHAARDQRRLRLKEEASSSYQTAKVGA